MTHQKPLIRTILAALAASAVAQTLLELAKLIIDRIRTILGPGPPTHPQRGHVIFDCATSFIIGFIIARLRQTTHSDAKNPAETIDQMFESQRAATDPADSRPRPPTHHPTPKNAVTCANAPPGWGGGLKITASSRLEASNGLVAASLPRRFSKMLSGP